MHESVPKPHGPRWSGPKKVSRYRRRYPNIDLGQAHFVCKANYPPNDWWCTCHQEHHETVQCETRREPQEGGSVDGRPDSHLGDGSGFPESSVSQAGEELVRVQPPPGSAQEQGLFSKGSGEDPLKELLSFKALIILLVDQEENPDSLGEALTFGLTWLRGGRTVKAGAMLDQDLRQWFRGYKVLTRENLLHWADEVEIDSNISKPLVLKEIFGEAYKERTKAERLILDLIVGRPTEKDISDEEGPSGCFDGASPSP